MEREQFIDNTARRQFVEAARRVEHAMRTGRHDRDLRLHNHATGTEEPWPTALTDENVASFWPHHNPHAGRAQALYRDAREEGDNPHQALARVLQWVKQDLDG